MNADASAMYAAILSTAPADCIKIMDAENVTIHDIVGTLRRWRERTERLEVDVEELQAIVDSYGGSDSNE